MWVQVAYLVDTFFGGDAPSTTLNLGQIAARSLLLFVAGLALVRLGKSRLMSGATPLDMLLAIVLGSLLSRGITGPASLSGTIVAMATLVVVHWVLTWLCFRSHALGNLVKGHARLLVSNGEIQWSSLRQSHISEHDLMESLRLRANIDDPSRVECAYKERSGEIGVVLRPTAPKVVDIDVQPGVQTVRIELSSL